MFEPLCPLHYEATQRLLETLGSAPRMETGMSLVPADREETPPVDDGAGSELAGSGGGEGGGGRRLLGESGVLIWLLYTRVDKN